MQMHPPAQDFILIFFTCVGIKAAVTHCLSLYRIFLYHSGILRFSSYSTFKDLSGI